MLSTVTGFAALIFPNYCTFTVLPALTTLCQTHACSNFNASTSKNMAFSLSHTLVPTSGTVSPKTLGTLLLSFPSTLNYTVSLSWVCGRMSIHHSSQFDISSDKVYFHTVSTFRELQLNVRKVCTF